MSGQSGSLSPWLLVAMIAAPILGGVLFATLVNKLRGIDKPIDTPETLSPASEPKSVTACYYLLDGSEWIIAYRNGKAARVDVMATPTGTLRMVNRPFHKEIIRGIRAQEGDQSLVVHILG